MKQSPLFDPRFLERFVGKHILYDPKVAIIELIANAWDAGAKKVEITWPTRLNEQFFSIQDDGIGMSKEEFLYRWRTLAYDRLNNQGETIEVDKKIRTVFGRNGVGRFAGFCFGENYIVRTCKSGNVIEYAVETGSGPTPFTLNERSPKNIPLIEGTRIYVESPSLINIDDENIRSEIGMRFLTDPSFSCYVNGVKVSFNHISDSNISKEEIELASGHVITIKIIDTLETDKTTKQHGIAWHVNNRLVGESNWKNYGLDEIVDGRSGEAKRHTFIVSTNHLSNSVQHDWTQFKDTEEFSETRVAVFGFVKKHILGRTRQKRNKVLNNVKSIHKNKIDKLTPLRQERWEEFIVKIQEECTSLSEKDLVKLAGVLVKMEESDSKYDLINKLHDLNSGQIDNLDTILSEWSVDLAKEVLDELQVRLKLLDELKERVFDKSTREVQDLQPLFHQGLWIFGPEFETIEFTSNEGMTKVLQNLYKSNQIGSRNRPDFAILKDSTVGTYSYPTYDDEGGEIGVDRLVIVELKKPGIPISEEEKGQCWKYVKELIQKGMIDRNSKVTCFVLGSEVDPVERSARKENDNKCIIQPMDYQVVINRAKSRLLRLYDRVKGAPFLEAQRSENDTDIQQAMDF